MTRRGWLLFAGMSLVWGIPYLFIKVAVEGGLAPVVVAWARVAIAALLLAPVAWRAGALRGLLLILAGSWLSTRRRAATSSARS